MKIQIKFLIFLVSSILTFNSSIVAQDCNDFFPFEQGRSWEMSHFNAKAKLTGKTAQQIISKRVEGTTTISVIKTESTDEKGKNATTNEFEISCNGGIFKMSAKSFIPQESMQSMESMDVKMDVKDLEMPTVLAPGMSLPDGHIIITASMNGMTVMNTTIYITNRKIEGKETITTDAGTFECFKITETSTMKMGFMNQTTTTTSWFAPKFGTIKSEHYDKNGKMDSYSLMTKIN